ncbi:hypothetical protein PLESTB_000271900 [Pleodorina starrii]|uniref:Uncharacterized protein n=1 Tax=Pleodorina starrii TaxID=330485 RepID=A0A9W6BDP7_9CHLO|nr:hypothetical protein PLESTB_000271900 [Pleodorina starrii]
MNGGPSAPPAVHGAGGLGRAAPHTPAAGAAGPSTTVKLEPGAEAEEEFGGRGDADVLSDGCSEDPDDYDIGGAAAGARGSDGGGPDYGRQQQAAAAAAGDVNTPLLGTHSGPQNQTDGKQRGKTSRFPWGKAVNEAKSKTTYLEYLDQAIREKEVKNVTGAKETVELLLPVMQQYIRDAGGDGSLLTFRRLQSKLTSLRKKPTGEESVAGVGAKRPLESINGVLTPDPRRPGPRRQQDVRENPTSNGLAAGAPAEAMDATNAPADVARANGGAAAAVPHVGAAAASGPLYSAVGTEDLGPASAASRGPAAASREPPPARAAHNPVAAQAAAARDGLVHEEGGAAMAGGAPEQQAPDGGRSSGNLHTNRHQQEPGLEESIELSLADAFLGGESDAAGGATGPADEGMLRTCGMLDDELQGIAATIALLDPGMLQSLAAAKDKAANEAEGSKAVATAAKEDARMAGVNAAAARERLREMYMAAGKACSEAVQQLATAEHAAAYDRDANKVLRVTLEDAEEEMFDFAAECEQAVDRARQAAEKAEADRVAASSAETSYQDVEEAAVKVRERLGGGSGSGGGGGEEIVRQLPDLVKWAVDFMGRLSPERRLAAVRAAAAAAREGGSNEEQELRLFARLPRLQERSHENKDMLAFRLAQQITNRYLRVGGRRAV